MSDRFEQETLPHLDELRGRARRLLGRADLADDLVQETFLRAYAARESYQLGTNARAWLHRILGNAVWAAQRREQCDRRLGEHLQFAEEPWSVIEPAELFKPTVQALADLPQRAREVIQLVDLDGLGYAEAARMLDLPIGTIMSRLHRARARLRCVLAREAA